VGYRM